MTNYLLAHLSINYSWGASDKITPPCNIIPKVLAKRRVSMKFHSVLSCSLVLVMVAAFLYQMWELFGQFLSGLTTVAISFEEKEEFELPSFAFCDSRAFTKSVSIEETLTRYNDTTFDLEEDISFNGMMKNVRGKAHYSYVNHTRQIVPTMFNGYCKLYEFQQSYPVETYLGLKIVGNVKHCHQFLLLTFRVCSTFEKVI